MKTKQLLKRNHWKELFWGFAAQGINVGAGILLLPFLLRRFSTAEIAVWFILTTVHSLIVILDFGVSLTVSRNIAYVSSGAQKLLHSGLHNDQSSGVEKSEINSALLLNLLDSARQLYFVISASLFVFLAIAGSWYFFTVAAPVAAQNHIHIIWIMHIVFCTLNLYFGYVNAALYGFGKIIESAKIVFFSRLAFIILALVFLYAGGGLLSLVMASGIMILGLRLGAIWIYGGIVKNIAGSAPSSCWKPWQTNTSAKQLTSTLWHNARRTGLISLASFLVVRANTFVCATFVGLEETASYALSLQLFSVLVAFSQVGFNNSLPAISAARIHSDFQKFRSLIRFALSISLVTYLTGALVILFLGDHMLILIHSHTPLLDKRLLFAMAIILLLELNHNNFASVISTRNEIPYLFSYLFSGVSIVITSIALIHFTHLGIWALLLTQGSIQLLYNNWRWPLEVWRELSRELKI